MFVLGRSTTWVPRLTRDATPNNVGWSTASTISSRGLFSFSNVHSFVSFLSLDRVQGVEEINCARARCGQRNSYLDEHDDFTCVLVVLPFLKAIDFFATHHFVSLMPFVAEVGGERESTELV